jgi:hypothetical protein
VFGGWQACLTTNIDEGEEYVAKHVIEGCNCEHFFISTADESLVANAIIRGEIPVVHMRDDDMELVVDIQTHTPSSPMRYTAISHV